MFGRLRLRAFLCVVLVLAAMLVGTIGASADGRGSGNGPLLPGITAGNTWE